MSLTELRTQNHLFSYYILQKQQLKDWTWQCIKFDWICNMGRHLQDILCRCWDAPWIKSGYWHPILCNIPDNLLNIPCFIICVCYITLWEFKHNSLWEWQLRESTFETNISPLMCLLMKIIMKISEIRLILFCVKDDNIKQYICFYYVKPILTYKLTYNN